MEVIESSASAVEFKWRPPRDAGGSPITDYILERQQIGRNSWKKLGKIGPEAKYRDLDVDHGRKYCYHIRAETAQGTSEMIETDDLQAGTKGECQNVTMETCDGQHPTPCVYACHPWKEGSPTLKAGSPTLIPALRGARVKGCHK